MNLSARAMMLVKKEKILLMGISNQKDIPCIQLMI